VVAPVAVGETFIATARGFHEWRAAGSQSTADGRGPGGAGERGRARLRDGGAITRSRSATPWPRACRGESREEGAWVLRLLREQQSLAGDAEDDEILGAQLRLARTEGIWAGRPAWPPGGADPPAREKRLDPGQTICVILSETGLKTEAEPPSRSGTAFRADRPPTLVLARLGAR